MHSTAYLLISVIPVINLYHLCLADPVLMCYYTSTARLRIYFAKFEVKDINFTLCTHYIYQYAAIDRVTHKLVASYPYAEEGPNGLYRQFTNAKITFSSIKTLLAVGEDILFSQERCREMARNTTLINVFATSAASLLRQYGFDGLDMSCTPNIGSGERYNMLKALREKFDEITSNNRLMLTVSASAMDTNIQAFYNVPEMAKTLDYVIIGTHKLYYNYMNMVHFPTPMYPRRSRHPFNRLSLNFSLTYWNGLGMPYNKIVVGFSGLGRLLELEEQTYQPYYEPWALITNTYLLGPDYKISRGLAYPETCVFRQLGSKHYDDIQKSPYMLNGLTWVGYDDPESLELKIKWVTQFGVAGIMFASIDVDDFTGVWCSDGKFPLLVAMNKAIMRILPEKDPPTTTTMITTIITENESTDNNSSTTGGDVTDSTVSVTGFTDTPPNNNNMINNLLIGILILLVLIVYVVLCILCLRKHPDRHRAE